jgi:CDP-Glycerol:Poly(glycerophosphate) glycerophosphotransferase
MTLRGTLTRPLHSLDHAIGRALGPRRVLFEGRLPVHFIVVRPVLDALRADPRVRVWVTSDGREDIARAYAEAGFGDCYLPRERCAWGRFDLYMNGDPWNPARLHRSARRMNFFHGVAGKYDLDLPPPGAGLFAHYDRVAFVNADRMRRYLESGTVTERQAALVGYPKLDRLLTTGYDGAAVRRSLGLPVERPTVVYAPTWSSASSLHVAGEAIIQSLLASGFNVIAKLHDNCFMPGEKCAGDVDWRARLKGFSESACFVLANSHDSSPYLAACDVLVTDHSSIGFEALALDRPVIVFEAPDLPQAARINPEKIELLRSASDVVTTPAELAVAAAAALVHPGRRAPDRRRVAQQIFYAPGGATARAVAVVYELLAGQ